MKSYRKRNNQILENIHTYKRAHTHKHIHERTGNLCLGKHLHIHTYIHTYIHTECAGNRAANWTLRSWKNFTQEAAPHESSRDSVAGHFCAISNKKKLVECMYAYMRICVCAHVFSRNSDAGHLSARTFKTELVKCMYVCILCMYVCIYVLE